VNCLEGSQDVCVASAYECKIGIHSQLVAEKRPFHVLNCKRISVEETIDVSRFDKAHQVLASACSDNCRSRDHCDFAFSCPGALQLPSQYTNDPRLRFVGIDGRVDELKEVSARSRTLHRDHANALMTDYNLV